jgi:hypothetical protein
MVVGAKLVLNNWCFTRYRVSVISKLPISIIRPMQATALTSDRKGELLTSCAAKAFEKENRGALGSYGGTS